MRIMDFKTFNAEEYYRSKGWLIGEGCCGGKAKGLAYATCALKESDFADEIKTSPLLFVLSTEVFHDFIAHASLEGLFECGDWDLTQKRIMETDFSNAFHSTLAQILHALDSAGQLPLAIRSSSLLEDSVSLSFAGKYETHFSANVGPFQERLLALENAVKKVFASLFNPSAQAYRTKHGKQHAEEAMAVIIQPMIGRKRETCYYPELAGTLFSRVFRRPSPRIQKEDGGMRLCFGMGTRTVDRCAARIFYLTNPALRPAGNTPERIAEASQEYFDYIDLSYGAFLTGSLPLFLPFLLRNHQGLAAAIQLYEENLLAPLIGQPAKNTRPLFSFPEIHIRHRHLFDLSKKLLTFMEQKVGMPVDIEFTYETEPREFNLLQMRPLAAFEEMQRVEIPQTADERILFKADRMVSNGKLEHITHLVYVDAEQYLNPWSPAETARAIGEINRELAGSHYILAGPGRWGSRNPARGVPITYAEICNSGCLVEISIPELNFSPELSFGTHFFLDMDSDGTLYLPVFSSHNDNYYAKSWLDHSPYRTGTHPSIRIYEGDFSVYLDGESEQGVVIQ